MDIALGLDALIGFSNALDAITWVGTVNDLVNISDTTNNGLYLSDSLAIDSGISSLNKLAYMVNARTSDSGLTGGVNTGVVLQNVSNDNGTITLTDGGTLIKAPISSVLQSSMSSLGLNVNLEDCLSTQQGREILRDCIYLLDNSFNSTNEQNLLEKISNGTVTIPFADGKTYVPYNFISRMKDILADSTIYNDDTFPAMTTGYNQIIGSLSLEKTISMAASACRKAMLDGGRTIDNIALYTRALQLAKTRLYNNMASKGMVYSECFFVATVSSSNSKSWSVSVGAYQYTNQNTVAYNSASNDLVIARWGDYVNVAGGSASVYYVTASGVEELVERVGDGTIADNARYKYGTGYAWDSDWFGTACGINGVSYNPVGFVVDGMSTQIERDEDISVTFPSWALDLVRSIGVVDTLNPSAAGAAVLHLPLGLDVVGTLDTPIYRPQTDVQVGTTIPAVIEQTIPQTIVIPREVVTVRDIEVEIELPDTPITPTPILPTLPEVEGASGLFTVYNPTRGELDSAGAELWTTNFLQQIKELFTNNPLDAVIGVQIVYSPVSKGTRKKITFGAYPTDTDAATVANQYSSIDCGSVSLPEKYGNVLDYNPYTSVNIFLPFIGIRKLNTDDVMASTIHVSYKVDVYTGTCLAVVEVTRKNATIALYKYEGNCAVQIPITGASRSGIISGLVGAVGGAIAGGVAGGVAGAVTSVAGGSLKERIDRSGSFTGNAGAMDIKTPYLIVSRDNAYTADSFNEICGYASYKRVALKNVSGYTRIKEVICNTINCTAVEKREIQSLLESGVYI